jgi:hypothetical protein
VLTDISLMSISASKSPSSLPPSSGQFPLPWQGCAKPVPGSGERLRLQIFSDSKYSTKYVHPFSRMRPRHRLCCRGHFDSATILSARLRESIDSAMFWTDWVASCLYEKSHDWLLSRFWVGGV